MSFKQSRTLLLIVLLTVACVSSAFKPQFSRQQSLLRSSEMRMMSDKSDGGDAMSRRRKRRGKDEIAVTETTNSEVSLIPLTILCILHCLKIALDNTESDRFEMILQY